MHITFVFFYTLIFIRGSYMMFATPAHTLPYHIWSV